MGLGWWCQNLWGPGVWGQGAEMGEHQGRSQHLKADKVRELSLVLAGAWDPQL